MLRKDVSFTCSENFRVSHNQRSCTKFLMPSSIKMHKLAWYCTDTMTVTNTLSLVLVSQRTSSCCTRRDRLPATASPAVEVRSAITHVVPANNCCRGSSALTTAGDDAVEALQEHRVNVSARQFQQNLAKFERSQERTGCAALENFPKRSMMLTVAWPGHVKHDCAADNSR